MTLVEHRSNNYDSTNTGIFHQVFPAFTSGSFFLLLVSILFLQFKAVLVTGFELIPFFRVAALATSHVRHHATEMYACLYLGTQMTRTGLAVVSNVFTIRPGHLAVEGRVCDLGVVRVLWAELAKLVHGFIITCARPSATFPPCCTDRSRSGCSSKCLRCMHRHLHDPPRIGELANGHP